MRRRYPLLLSLAFALAPATWSMPARAQMPLGLAGPTAEVCDTAPAAAAGRTAAAIVRTACQEHRQWQRPFIETDGRLVSLGATEAERARLADGSTPAWRQVARYWRESGTLSALAATPGASSCRYASTSREVDNDCRAFIVDNPWSAAFISWVMARSPLYGFGGSPRHIDYIARAWRDPQGSPYLFADPFSARPAPGDLLCFLRSGDQGRGAAGLRQALGGEARLPTRSHCEIVVAAGFNGDGKLYLIGGNVLNSVVMRKLPLDRDGRLLPSALGVPARAAPGTPVYAADDSGMRAIDEAAEEATPPGAATCRPGDPAACSFNHRDWAVLLRLKPQSQLGGYFQVATSPATPAPSAQAPDAPAPGPATPVAPAPAPSSATATAPAPAPTPAPATTPATTPASTPPPTPAPMPAPTPTPASAATQPPGTSPAPPARGD